jgi:hypothetical protein
MDLLVLSDAEILPEGLGLTCGNHVERLPGFVTVCRLLGEPRMNPKPTHVSSRALLAALVLVASALSMAACASEDSGSEPGEASKASADAVTRGGVGPKLEALAASVKSAKIDANTLFGRTFFMFDAAPNTPAKRLLADVYRDPQGEIKYLKWTGEAGIKSLVNTLDREATYCKPGGSTFPAKKPLESMSADLTALISEVPNFKSVEYYLDPYEQEGELERHMLIFTQHDGKTSVLVYAYDRT